MKGYRTVSIRILLWSLYFLLITWVLNYILRHHSIHSDEIKWLQSFGYEEKVPDVDKSQNGKTPDYLTYYKTLPKEGVKP